jgi:hypothetical protein
LIDTRLGEFEPGYVTVSPASHPCSPERDHAANLKKI